MSSACPVSELPTLFERASRELAFTCDASGVVTWADERAQRLLSMQAGTRFDLHAAPGTEGKIAQLLSAASAKEERWELAVIVGGKPATAVFSAAPHQGGLAFLGSLVPADYGAIVGQVTSAMAEIVTLNRDTARQKKVIEQRHLEVVALNRSLEDSMRAVKAMHAELEDRAEALRRSVDVRGRVVSNVSHEFRTPLHAMLGLSQLLLDEADGPLTAEQRKQISFIRQGAEQLSEMVNDLLDLSKIEAGKVLIRSEKFAVGEFFGALRGMLAPLWRQDSGVRLVFEEPPAELFLETDRAKVSQVMRNLISNALKFTQQGEVRISAARGADGLTRLVVRDTGLGIAPDDHERVFEEFEQIAGPEQARVRGTGLGLPISRRIATLLSGTLTLESELGKGATFTLTLPLIHPEVREMEALTERSMSLDPTRTPILVVEDDRKTMFVYERYLAQGGFQVIPARTVDEARAALTRIRPAAILLDIMLEQESTWTFLGELKLNRETADIPVLVITIINKAQKARALGADEFWLKPVDKDRLLRKLGSISKPGAMTRVLTIDDDEAARYMLRKHLNGSEFRLIEAATGPEGVRLAQERLPHIIFLDFLLQDETAFDVLDALKADSRTRSIPVILSTSYPLDDEQVKRLSLLTEAIIPKQDLSRELAIDRIREALARAGLGVRGAQSG